MITLSSGHVFAKESVKVVSPVVKGDCWDSEDAYDSFTIHGIGFTITLFSDDLFEGVRRANQEKRKKFADLHQEAVQKLIV